MQSVSESNFGPLIAYIVPGATAMWGASYFSPLIQTWFASTGVSSPTIGGFLYLTLGSLAFGMTVSAVRWAVVDTVHRLTGLKPPNLDFSRLDGKVDSFGLLIEIHYRHYQFYANMFVATFVAYACFWLSGKPAANPALVHVGFVAIEAVFLLTSRDTLRKYYVRTKQLFATQMVVTPFPRATADDSAPIRGHPQTGSKRFPDA